MRPKQISFRLTRTKDGAADSFSDTKYANEDNGWECGWNQLAAFSAAGERFEYFVEEMPVANYTTSGPVETDETEHGETTKILTFTNTYTPTKNGSTPCYVRVYAALSDSDLKNKVKIACKKDGNYYTLDEFKTLLISDSQT